MALSIIQYTDATSDRLPAKYLTFRLNNGDVAAACPQVSRLQSFGWRTSILPYLEENAVEDKIDYGRGAWAKENVAALSSVIPSFQCPSTPGSPRAEPWRNGLFGVLQPPRQYRESMLIDGIVARAERPSYRSATKEREFI